VTGLAHTKMNSHMCTNYSILGSHLSIRLRSPNKKLTAQELCGMVRWTYSSKEISNSWACAMNLAKFAQKWKHEIYDLGPTKLETDCQNVFISSTHIFFMYSLFWFEPWLCWLQEE
jgi:hypothetical protein